MLHPVACLRVHKMRTRACQLPSHRSLRLLHCLVALAPLAPQVDYKGQEFAERIYQVIIVVTSLIGFVWGYTKEDFKYAFYVWAIGLFASIVICTPDWPMFNKNPIKWQPSVIEKLESIKVAEKAAARKGRGGKKR